MWFVTCLLNHFVYQIYGFHTCNRINLQVRNLSQLEHHHIIHTKKLWGSTHLLAYHIWYHNVIIPITLANLRGDSCQHYS